MNLNNLHICTPAIIYLVLAVLAMSIELIQPKRRFQMAKFSLNLVFIGAITYVFNFLCNSCGASKL
jgi:hypothetical protein